MNNNYMNFLEENCWTTQTSARIGCAKKMKKKRTGEIHGIRCVKKIEKKRVRKKLKKRTGKILSIRRVKKKLTGKMVQASDGHGSCWCALGLGPRSSGLGPDVDPTRARL